MAKTILKWLGILLLILLALVAIYAAMHPRAMRNMVRVGGAGVAEVDVFQPAQVVRGCTGAPFERAPDGTLPAASFAAMKRYSDALGGRALVVLVDGKIAAEAYAPGTGPGTRMQSYSMHKSMVGILTGAAIADGLIGSVDDPVGTYISEWKRDPRGTMTIRQLLTQSSGIHNPSMATMEGAAVEIMLGEVTRNTLALPRDSGPGTFNYSNANFQLAGTAIARATKRRGGYAAYLSGRIWCPLGNADALLWLEHAGGEPRYFAYLNATVRDWARVGELLRRRGDWNGRQLVPAEWVDSITAPSPGNPNYGMGIWRGSPWLKARRYSREVSLMVPQNEAFLADDVVYFDGFGGQRVYVVPSAGLVIARAGEPDTAWEESALVNAALRGLRAKQ